jgi:hypothetical protein
MINIFYTMGRVVCYIQHVIHIICGPWLMISQLYDGANATHIEAVLVFKFWSCLSTVICSPILAHNAGSSTDPSSQSARRLGREATDTASVFLHVVLIIKQVLGCVLKAVAKWGVKGQGRVMEGVEWIKVKYTYNGETLRNSFEHQLKY